MHMHIDVESWNGKQSTCMCVCVCMCICSNNITNYYCTCRHCSWPSALCAMSNTHIQCPACNLLLSARRQIGSGLQAVRERESNQETDRERERGGGIKNCNNQQKPWDSLMVGKDWLKNRPIQAGNSSEETWWESQFKTTTAKREIVTVRYNRDWKTTGEGSGQETGETTERRQKRIS